LDQDSGAAIVHFPHRILHIMVAAAVIVGTAWIWGTSASADPVNILSWQETEAGVAFAAHVHRGDCTLFNPADAVGSGEAVSEPGGPHTAYAFDIELDVSMSVLVETPHAITLESLSPEVAAPQACGEIVGTASDGRLVTGIWALGSDALEGIAVLESTGEKTTKVSVYLVLFGEGDQPVQEDAEDDDGDNNEPDDDDSDDPEGGL
jgi:hypothetical protein